MKKLMTYATLTVVLAVVFAALATPALAWNEGYDIDESCTGATATINAVPESIDHSGFYQTRWFPITTSGAGFYPWDSNGHAEIYLDVDYQKQESFNFGITWSFVVPAAYSEGDGPQHFSPDANANCKTNICHANEGINDYSLTNVSWNAVNGVGSGDHNGDGHQDGQDIIPPGFWDADGRNWAEGQAIFNNGCRVLATPTPTPTFTFTPTPTDTDTPTFTPTATDTPTETATDEPSATPTATPTDTATPEDTPTDVVEPTATPTFVEQGPTPTPEPTRVPRCKKDKVPCGWSWHLVGPEGQTAWFTSFSLRPGGDPNKGPDWYPPNVQAVERCAGWIPVGNLPGKPYYGVQALISCDGGKCVVK